MPFLYRSLNLTDAVFLGLAAMLGAGIFAAITPAFAAAGGYIIFSLLIAGAIAYCNAVSSAQLAACHPQAGGTYLYARERLNPTAGFIAGACFLSGKSASGAAMALTFAHYAAPGYEKPAALGALCLLTGLNLWGIEKTARVSRIIVTLVVLALLLLVAACLSAPAAQPNRLIPTADFSLYGLAQGAAIWFFAFAGYARLATLAEEVNNPSRVLTRAIPLSLFLVLGLYLCVLIGVLLVTPPDRLVQAKAPLTLALSHTALASFSPVLRLVASLACLGVLVALIAGISRTLLAMSRNRDMPTYFSTLSAERNIPVRAELAVAGVIAVVIMFLEVTEAIGFSAFCVLLYYALANAAALKLAPQERHWPIAYSYAGLIACLLLALSVPLISLLLGSVTVLGLTLYYRYRR